jgi:hypothetical protein
MIEIVCPKCGHKNKEGAVNCAGCRTNLQWALEHADEFAAEAEEKARHEETEPLTVKCPKCSTVNLREVKNCRACGVNLKRAIEHPQEEWQRQAVSVLSVPPFGEYIENEIKKQARGALIDAIVGIFFFGIILGPSALYRANKAIRLIQEHKTGQEHEAKAKAAQIIAAIALCLWLLLCILQFAQS